MVDLDDVVYRLKSIEKELERSPLSFCQQIVQFLVYVFESLDQFVQGAIQHGLV
jgi:hypothetical protein